jgi:hypothetical protein
MARGVFLDSEGALENTTFESTCNATEEHGVQ